MKLEEAIEIIKLPHDDRHFILYEKEREAEKLLIEAGKWRLLMEHDYGSWCGPPLPGETKE